MRNCILTFTTLLLFISKTYAQCPSVSFTLPDSLCANTAFTVTNTSPASANSIFNWDFNTGDLSLTPSGVNLGSGGLAFPHQVRPVVINGNRHVFICNFLGNNLLRLDFGNSFENVPTPYIYGNFGGLMQQPIGLDLIKENGVWYALVVNNQSKKLVRINLGSNITANIASATDLGLFGFDNPRNLKVIKDGVNNFVFVTNELGNNINRVDFGNSITNTPSGSAAINDPLFVNMWGIDIGYDCAASKFVGFAVSFNQNKVYTLDFGSSLSNTPTIAGNVTTEVNCSGLQLVKDGASWHVVVSVFGSSKLQNFLLGSSLMNPPVSIYSANPGTVKSPNCIGIVKDSSVYYAFTSNTSPATLSRVKWDESFLNTPAVSNDPVSVNVVSAAGGYQTYSLTITDTITGSSNTFVDSIFFSSAPTGAFVTNPGCEGLPVVFTDSSTINGGIITSWEWDFGDGSPVDLNQNTSHTYTGTGTFNVTLVTSSDAGCYDTTITQITITPNPVADFSFTNNQCQFTNVSFNDLSQSSGGTTNSGWIWDFGDSTSTDTTQNPFHTFSAPGVFTVSLIVTTDAGCTDSTNYDITIFPTPEPGFTVASTCIGETVEFTNATTIQGGGSLDFNWDFGDSTGSILTDPLHQYAATGANYDVTLIATSTNGCTDTITQNIHIASPPVPQFVWSPLTVCSGNTVSFLSSSTGTMGDTISAYLWDFGDLMTSDLENPDHIYADTGYYNVTLTVISPTYCDSSLTQQIQIIPGPEAVFTAQGVCLNEPTIFNLNTTTPPGTVIDSLVWDFGDGNGFSGLTSPSHTYIAPGRYGVSVTVYNDLMCTGVFIDSVDVYPLPVSDFTNTLICTGNSVTFDGTSSTVSNGTITSWLWDFGGMGSATTAVAQFTFSNPDTLDVVLITTTNFGCSDTLVQQVFAIQSPQFSFQFNEPCLGDPAIFTYQPLTSPPPPSNLTWSFGDSTSSALLNPSHIYNYSDTFNVSLTVMNPNTGCLSNSVSQIFIKPLPVAGFSVANVCEGDPIDFTDTTSIESGNISNWNWDFGILGTSTDQNPSLSGATAGNYNVSLNVISDLGCSDIATGGFTIYSRPVADIIPDPLFGSPPLTVNFINNTSGATSYNWDFGDNTSGTGVSPVHMYGDTGYYNVTMIAASAEGCLDTAYSTVSVLIPYMDIAVKEIFASFTDSKMKLSATLTNFGNITITEATIRGIIENGTVISETFTGTLLPGASVFYEFSATYEVSDNYSVTYYCVEAADPNNDIDQNLSNNKKCAVVSTVFEIYNAYPVPFQDELNINLNLNNAGSYTVELYDAAGRLVRKNLENSGVKGFNTAVINTYGLANGNYTVTVKFRDEQKSIKVLKASQKN